MGEDLKPQYEEVIKGSRKLVKKEKYTTIYDPRIENYPGTHPLFHELSPKSADQGPKWVMVPNELLEEAEAILDKYPEQFEENQNN